MVNMSRKTNNEIKSWNNDKSNFDENSNTAAKLCDNFTVFCFTTKIK